MFILFDRTVHEALAEAIAADEILGNRGRAEAKLAFAAQHVSRFHGGMFPGHGTLVLPRDFADRPALTEILVNYTGGLPVRFADSYITPEIINRVNQRYNRP